MDLSIYAEKENIEIFKALSSETRLSILQLISEKKMNIKDISSAIGLSAAIVTRHIDILEECGIVTSEFSSAKHGRQRLCCLAMENIFVIISSLSKVKKQEFEFLLGSYYEAIDIQAPCGIENEDGTLGIDDDKRYFMSKERNSAEHIWFTNGMLRYKVNELLNGTKVKTIEIELNISVDIFLEKYNNGKMFFGICGYKICEDTYDVFRKPKKILLRIDETGVKVNNKHVSTTTINEIPINPSNFTFEVGAGFYHGVKTILNLYTGEGNDGIKVRIEII